MATGIEQAQTSVSTCPDHTHQLLLSYCRTCQKRVCEACVKGPHSEHDWTFLQNHIRQIRNEGHKIAKEIREEIIAFLKAKRDGVTREQEEAKIRAMQQNLKDLIDEYADEMVTQLDDDEDVTDVKREIEEFEGWAVFFEEKIRTEYDSVVLEMEEEFQARLHQHRATKAATKYTQRKFKQGTIDRDIIKAMMGSLEEDSGRGSTAMVVATDVKIVEFANSNILSIETESERLAWIHCSGMQKTSLINKKGIELSSCTYGTKFTNFFIKHDDQIFSHGHEKYIAVLSSGEVRKICSTSLYPYGICPSQGGGVLVCLSDTPHPNGIKSSSMGEIQEMDMTGKMKKRYHQNKTDDTKSLTFPYRIAQNVNSDLCVCDWLHTDGRGRLVVITQDNSVRFTYEGQSSLTERFSPRDVVCDSHGRIILSDFYNNAIHRVNEDGPFLQFLLTSNDGIVKPRALALHGDNLWVGNDNGVITICKLKEQSP